MVQWRFDVDDGDDDVDFCRRLCPSLARRPLGYARRHRLVRDHRSRFFNRYSRFACGCMPTISDRAAGSFDDFDGDPFGGNVLDIRNHFELVAIESA